MLSLLDRNQQASKEELENSLNDLEKVCSPIMTKIHQEGAAAAGHDGPEEGSPPGGGAAGGSSSSGRGPTIEEVDSTHWIANKDRAVARIFYLRGQTEN